MFINFSQPSSRGQLNHKRDTRPKDHTTHIEDLQRYNDRLATETGAIGFLNPDRAGGDCCFNLFCHVNIMKYSRLVLMLLYIYKKAYMSFLTNTYFAIRCKQVWVNRYVTGSLD